MTVVLVSKDVAANMRPSALRRAALRDACIAWLAHEAAVAGVMVLSVRIGVAGAALVHARVIQPPVTLRDLLAIWLGWGDAGSYAQVAAHGYTSPTLLPYYPLLPLLERALSPLTGGDARAAGFAIANLAALPALYLLRSLAERETNDRRLARLALVLAAFTPFAFFMALGYTESLFLLLSLAAIATARDKRWLAAGIFAGLATLTRATGLLLVVPILIEAGEASGWRFPGWRTLVGPLVAAALPALAQLGFWLYQAAAYGTPLAAAVAARTNYSRWLDWPWYGPLVGLAVVARHADPWPTARALLELATVACALACAVALARRRLLRMPSSYIAYGWAVLVFTLAIPIHGATTNAQYSLPRYLLVDFPLYLAPAALCARNRWVRLAVVAGSMIVGLLLALLQTAAFAIA